MKSASFFRCGNHRGSVLLVCMAALLVLSVVAITSMQTSNIEMNIAGNDVRRTQALLAAEAGLAQSETIFRQYPKQLRADTLMMWINAASSLPNTSFRVAMDTGLPIRKVVAIGSSEESQAAIQVTYRYTMDPYNVWNNALFAGHGQDGMSIRGNTGIHGSVHILGNGEPFTDSNGNGVWDSGEPYKDSNHDGAYDRPLTAGDIALSMTGTATIGNNYLGMDATLKSRVPALETTPYGGENVQTLFGEVRVQHGQVELDGSAKVGQPNVSGGTPAVKETMDATWVTDGYTGSSATVGVNSDNGYIEIYDLTGGGTLMPSLDDPYTDKNGVSYADYMAYLRSKALVIPGNLTLQCGTLLPAVGSTAGSLAVDALGNVTASGIIYVQGNVNIAGACPVKYDGRFTLVAEGDVTVDADFYSKGMFATDDVAGVVAHGKISLGQNASQLRLAGAFFAQEKVLTNKQTQIAGSIVSNYFDMTQVPDIYQVPKLTENLPPGMPGADYVYAYVWLRVPKSWTELF